MSQTLDEFALTYFKEVYEHQFERTDALRDRFSLIVGVMSITGATLTFLISEFKHQLDSGIALMFYVPLAWALGLFAISLRSIITAMAGRYQYDYVAKNHRVRDAIASLKQWCAENNVSEADQFPSFKASLAERYCDAGEHNAKINRKRTTLLLDATRLALFIFPAIGACLPGFLYYRNPSTPQPIEVIILKS